MTCGNLCAQSSGERNAGRRERGEERQCPVVPEPRCNELEAGSRWKGEEIEDNAEHLGSAPRPNHARICPIRK